MNHAAITEENMGKVANDFNDFIGLMKEKYDQHCVMMAFLQVTRVNMKVLNTGLKEVMTSMPDVIIPPELLDDVSNLQKFEALSTDISKIVYRMSKMEEKFNDSSR